MNTRNLLNGSFLGIALLTQGAIALSAARERSSVTVLARGPAGLRIEGRGSEVALEEDASTLVFKVPVAPLETGVGLRDAHLREMLEVERYPAATLRVPKSQLTFPRQREPSEGTAEGDLTLHGQSRPVKVNYRAELAADGVIKVHGSMHLDMRDFDLKAPSFLGVTVAPMVEVKVELAVKDA